MTKALIFAVFLLNTSILFCQDTVVKKLYQGTYEVYNEIQQGNHIKALDKADELLKEYLDYPDGIQYVSYLYMYKAEAYLRLGDVLLSEYCSRSAMKMAGLFGKSDLQFIIEGNLAALDIEKQDYNSCYDRCLRLFSNPQFSPSKDQLGVTLNNMALSSFKI